MMRRKDTRDPIRYARPICSTAVHAAPDPIATMASTLIRKRATMRALVLALVLALPALPGLAGQPLTWFEAHRPAARRDEALGLLRRAGEHGLDPADYRAQALSDAAQSLAQTDDAANGMQRTLLDAALTDAMQRYLSDLQSGRVAPAQVGAAFTLAQQQRPDGATLLRQALAGNGLSDAVQGIAAQLPMAQPLSAALRRYRALAQAGGWQTPLPAPARGKLIAGDAYPALAELEHRLISLGDLQPRPTPPRADAVLIAAVRRFQLRHGLEPDGIVGRLTRAQLDVTPARRVRQIELTLERLRWTPLSQAQAQRMIVVNVPEFMLRAYTVQEGRMDMALEMKVIVGKALDTRTPLFDEDMRFIEFSPYWNVPRSIANGELLPRLRVDPSHFDDQGFEFVNAQGKVVPTLTEATLQAVEHGGWRIRQRPGPKNALGAIKFIFPNDSNIYLHHTPSPALFGRQRRDFSHGCIRVEEPMALARFVLQDDPAWTTERIAQSMAAGVSRTIRLRDPLPVLIAYNTVVVRQGMVHFYDDLYGHDRRLDDALRARSAALTRVPSPGAGP
jgi:murein L,D-transpeptidase YcbB/YkuD